MAQAVALDDAMVTHGITVTTQQGSMQLLGTCCLDTPHRKSGCTRAIVDTLCACVTKQQCLCSYSRVQLRQVHSEMPLAVSKAAACAHNLAETKKVRK